jgi:hypothetical protein
MLKLPVLFENLCQSETWQFKQFDINCISNRGLQPAPQKTSGNNMIVTLYSAYRQPCMVDERCETPGWCRSFFVDAVTYWAVFSSFSRP